MHVYIYLKIGIKYFDMLQNYCRPTKVTYLTIIPMKQIVRPKALYTNEDCLVINVTTSLHKEQLRDEVALWLVYWTQGQVLGLETWPDETLYSHSAYLHPGA